jgi:hypothetical protein
MAGSFLDTTIVIQIAEAAAPDRTAGAAFVKANQPATTPHYAFIELLSGRVRQFCDVHNSVRAAHTPFEALLALSQRNPIEGRKKASRIEILATVLNEISQQRPGTRLNETKREFLQAIAIKANRLWRQASKLKSVDTIQPLACRNGGSLVVGALGELRGPRDSFVCLKGHRCAAAAYIYDNRSNLTKMIAALHPRNLGDELADKGETRSRRKALKELEQVGPAKFDRGRCRALGDAYFAAMCPPGAVVATTNLVDHDPLCKALGKRAVVP